LEVLGHGIAQIGNWTQTNNASPYFTDTYETEENASGQFCGQSTNYQKIRLLFETLTLFEKDQIIKELTGAMEREFQTALEAGKR